jgi:hypothetical protein
MSFRFPMGHAHRRWPQLALAALVFGLGACDRTDSPTDATPSDAAPTIDEPASFATTSTGLIFDDVFNDFSKWSQEKCCSHSQTIVSSPARSSGRAARLELRRNDPSPKMINGSHRSELNGPRLSGWSRDRNGPFKSGDEAWFGFSMYIPSNWVNDAPYTPGGGEILFQLHEQPDNNNWSRNRTSFLRLIAEGGNLRWITYASPCKSTDGCWTSVPRMAGKQDGQMDWIGPMRKGQWDDWVIHAKWSYGSDGLLEFWRNGTKVATINGPNNYNTQQAGYVKLGIYKWSWSNTRITSRVVGYDAVKIAGKGGSYSMVAPR